MGIRTHDFVKFNDDRAALEFNPQSAAFTITVDGTVVYDSSAGTSAAELEYLDIATLGTGAASKAVVLDASGDYTYPAAATIVYPSGASLTLNSGSTFDVAGTFEIANVAMTASAAELNYNDITTLGTGAASKAVVLDAGEDYTWPATGILTYGVLKDPAGTTLGSTAAELNYLDLTTLGTGAASKAVVLDTGEDYTWPATGVLTYGVLKDPAATTITATGAEINKLDDSAAVMTKGSGVATGETYASGVFLNGTLKVTRIMVDLTTLVSGAADLDIIGDTGGAANAHFGQITAALNGTIVGGQVTCLEAPAGGATDIDFYSATVGTGAQDSDVTALTETVLITAGGAWTSGAVKGMTTVPPANDYLYIVNGAASAGAFSAGKFLIELYGV